MPVSGSAGFRQLLHHEGFPTMDGTIARNGWHRCRGLWHPAGVSTAALAQMSPVKVLMVWPQAMTGEHLGPKSACAALEELFLGGRRRGGAQDGVTLVLIDEMDLLLTRKQKVRAGWRLLLQVLRFDSAKGVHEN